MKKLTILLVLIIGFAFNANAQQEELADYITLVADSVTGKASTENFYSPFLSPYWDYSIQFKSTFYGLGDSSYFAVATYRSNDQLASVWEEIVAERDTLKTAIDIQSVTIEVTDFTGLWLKHTLTGIALDTTLIVPYIVMKVKRVID